MASSSSFTRRALLRTAALGAAGALAPRAACALAVESPSSPGWQIGIYTRPWAQYDYRVALDAIAEAGYRGAGLMTAKSKNGLVVSVHTSLEEARTIGEEARKRRLAVLSIYGGDFPVAKDSTTEGVQGLRKLIDNVAAAGCPALLLGGTGRADLQVPYYRIVAECCDYAAEKGVGMTVKPHGGLNSTGPQCRKCVELVGHKTFGLWYDPGNIFYYSDGKLDPADDAAAVDGLVRGMSVKDYKDPKNVDVTPGTGRVNFPAVMARLNRGGFTSGPLVIECLAAADGKAAPDEALKFLLGEARKAREFVEQLVRG